MKKEVRCCRCGTLINVNNYKKKRMIKCPHCNLQMMISKSSNIKIWIVKICFYIAVCALMLLLVNKVSFFKDVEANTIKYFCLLVSVGAITIGSALIIEDLANNIVNMLFGLDYIKDEKNDNKKKGKK